MTTNDAPPATRISPVPRKLNQGVIDALSEYIRKGNYASTSCALCGIGERTLYDWLQKAETDASAGLTEEESLYCRLLHSIKRAEAEAEDLMVQTARNAAVLNKDGYLAITVNERRHPDRWGRKDRQQIDVNEHKTITITHVEYVLPGREPAVGYIEGEARELVEGHSESSPKE